MKHKKLYPIIAYMLVGLFLLTGCNKTNKTEDVAYEVDDTQNKDIMEDVDLASNIQEDSEADNLEEEIKEKGKKESETNTSPTSTDSDNITPTAKPNTPAIDEAEDITPTKKPEVSDNKANQKPVITPAPEQKPSVTPTPSPSPTPQKPITPSPTPSPQKPSTPSPTPSPQKPSTPEVTPSPETDAEISSTTSLKVRGATIEMGSSISSVEKSIGNANRILTGEYNFDYYIYNNDYSKLLFLFVKDSKVVGFYTDSTDFNFMSITPESTISTINSSLGASYSMSSVISHNKLEGYTLRILMDNIGTKKVTGVYLLPDNISFNGYTSTVESNMDLMVLDLTNSIRVRNGLSSLKWSDQAHNAAYDHSKDMAVNSYFDHTGLNGSNPGERLKAAGVNWSSYGENIIGGYGNAILSTHGWLNSSGHRKNLLSTSFTHLGVGFYYNSNSSYKNYCTQNFYR